MRPAAARPAALTVVVLLAGCAPPNTRPVGDGAARTVAPTPSVAVPVTPSVTPSVTPPAVSTGCSPDGSMLRSEQGDAAMGLRVLGISLTNCGREPYRIDGYPEVRALDEDGTVLDVRALDGTTEITVGNPRWAEAPKPIVLKPGEQATTVLVWRNKYDDTTHPPVTVHYLEMAPLAGRPVQIVAPQGGLDLGSTGRFGFSPWLASPAEPDTGRSGSAPPGTLPPTTQPTPPPAP